MVLGAVLKWWLWLELFGLVGLPITLCLFRRLPDRGYPFARPVGLVLSGYLLWLGGSLGWWSSGMGGILVAMLLVFVVGTVALSIRTEVTVAQVGRWWKQQKTTILATEVLFGVALLGWAIFKSYNPNLETAGGEKWMEIAFVNALLGSDSFPPQDPWLSGYGISYYYFGYVLMSMVTRLSGLAATVAYNLFVPSLLAMSLVGAFSIVFNLVLIRKEAEVVEDGPTQEPDRGAALGFGLLGAVFVCLLGNLEGLLEVVHSRGLLPHSFWQWLDIKDLNGVAESAGWLPSRFMWWWRASRVVHDCSIQGLLANNCGSPNGDWEVIDEFPFFSFLLGDVHPHVLALPFVLLVVALALSLILPSDKAGTVVSRRGEAGDERPEGDRNLLVRWGEQWRGSIQPLFGSFPRFFLLTLLVGSLGFLNTWDFPIYLVVLGAVGVVFGARNGITGWLRRGLTGALIIGVLGGALYLPFYMSFSSQAGGLLPNLFNPTRLQQFLVFFGPFVVVAVAFLVVVSAARQRMSWMRRLPVSLAITVGGPVLVLLTVVGAARVVPSLRLWTEGLLKTPNLEAVLGDASVGSLLALSARVRIGNPWTFLVLGVLLGWCVALLWSAVEEKDATAKKDLPTSDLFVLILLGIGLALPLAVEFVYLRDNFGIRMNTVFKFYYQAWVLLALAAAYGVYVVAGSLRGAGKVVWCGVLAAMVGAGLVYPVLAIPTKAGDFSGTPTLDGMAWLAESRPDEYAAIVWLQENADPSAVVLEMPGDSYAAYQYTGRVSALTGLPTLLGWGNHESQWRGSYEIPAQREPDIEVLFNTVDTAKAESLLERYDVDYVFVGTLERERYNAEGLEKFETMLTTAYEGGNVTIYQRLRVDDR